MRFLPPAGTTIYLLAILNFCGDQKAYNFIIMYLTVISRSPYCLPSDLLMELHLKLALLSETGGIKRKIHGSQDKLVSLTRLVDDKNANYGNEKIVNNIRTALPWSNEYSVVVSCSVSCSCLLLGNKFLRA